MTQEDKQLLLKDLCARLPYTLYVRVEEFNIPKDEAITEGLVGNYLKDNRCNDYDAEDLLNELADDCINVKPYLRPMSSMTEEETKEFFSICTGSIRGDIIAKIDFYIKHHFDFRLTSEWLSMIESGLALEAPEGMYNIKEK